MKSTKKFMKTKNSETNVMKNLKKQNGILVKKKFQIYKLKSIKSIKQYKQKYQILEKKMNS